MDFNKGQISPIVIKAPFTYQLAKWKNNGLATIDGWGRFATIEFSVDKKGKDRIKVTPLANFPRKALDGWENLQTWPEDGLLWIGSYGSNYLTDVNNKVNREYWFKGIGADQPQVFDAEKCLILCNAPRWLGYRIYNYKTDEVLPASPPPGLTVDRDYNDHYNNGYYVRTGKDPETENRSYPMKWDKDTYLVLFASQQKNCFFNIRTGELYETEWTKKLYELTFHITKYRDNCYIDPASKKGFKIGFAMHQDVSDELRDESKWACRLSWKENCTDIQVTPLSYLHAGFKYFDYNFKGHEYYDKEKKTLTKSWMFAVGLFCISPDGKWGADRVSGFRGLYGEDLCKHYFIHFDDKYPNGMSILVFSTEYEEEMSGEKQFFEHPEYGMCLAVISDTQYIDVAGNLTDESKKDEAKYIKIYKMSDVEKAVRETLIAEAAS